MAYEVHVSDDFMVDGVAVYLSDKQGHDRKILHFAGNFAQSWDHHEPLANAEPSFRLPGELARALLDALMRFYQGSEDTRTARSDLLYERAQREKLQDILARHMDRIADITTAALQATARLEYNERGTNG